MNANNNSVNNVNMSSNVIVKCVEEMKVAIATAIRKIAVANPAVGEVGELEDAREKFISMLMAELFGDASVPVSAPVKEKKTKAKAKKAVAEPVVEADSVGEPAEAVAEPVAVPEAVEVKPKKSRGKKKEAVVEEVTTESVTIAEVVTEVKDEPKAKKPKAKKEKEAVVEVPKVENIDKLTPTQTKKMKAIADELKVAVPDKKDVLAYLNGLTSEVYNSKKMDDHLRSFLGGAPPPPITIPAELRTLPASPVAELGGTECTEVVFKGKVYYVDEATKKVYNDSDAYVGDVGINEFKDMVIPA